jgi:hypothetical protein
MAEARAAGWTLPNEQTGWQTLCRDHSKELPRNRLALVADLGGEAGAA